MYQSLMTQALESKERAKLCLSFFQVAADSTNDGRDSRQSVPNDIENELRKRGYRPLPLAYEGIYKKVYLSHDHVVKVGRNAEKEYRVYQRHDSYMKRYLVPTVRLGNGVILQPKGKPIAKWKRNDWVWKVCRNKWGAVVATAQQQLQPYVKDAHNGNFALFGDTILCIDFADY